MFRTVQLAAVY